MPDKVYVTWYDCDCEWISKYCDEYHRVGASVPVELRTPYIKRSENE